MDLFYLSDCGTMTSCKVTSEPIVGELHGNVLTALGQDIVSSLSPGQVLTLESVTPHTGVPIGRPGGHPGAGVNGMVAPSAPGGANHHPAVEHVERLRSQGDPLRLDVGDRAAQLLSLSELRRGFEPAPRHWPPSVPTRTSAGSWLLPCPTWWCTDDPAIWTHICWRTRYFTVPCWKRAVTRCSARIYDVVGRGARRRTHHGMMPRTAQPGRAIALHDEVARAVRLRDPEAAEQRCAPSSTSPRRRWPRTPPHGGIAGSGLGREAVVDGVAVDGGDREGEVLILLAGVTAQVHRGARLAFQVACAVRGVRPVANWASS